jgi:hypothetical protein
MSTPIKLRLITYNASVYRYAKPEKASKFKPDWYKDLPVINDKNTLEVKTNMRYCYGFNQLFNKGFILPFWNTCRVRLGIEGNTDYEWRFADDMSEAGPHPVYQRGSYLPEDKYSHLKFEAPWIVICDEPDVEFLYIGNTWLKSSPEDVVIPSGVLEFHKNRSVNLNVMMRRKATETYLEFEMGMPLVQIIPLSERPLELSVELVNDLEYKSMSSEAAITHFNKTQYKRMSNKHDSGCPFSK